MADKFRDGERKLVFYQYGSFEKDRRPRFVKAPFDLIDWADTATGATIRYLDTRGIGGPDTLEASLNASVPVWEEQRYRDEFGFISEFVVVQESSLGNGNDSWEGVHCIGLI